MRWRASLRGPGARVLATALVALVVAEVAVLVLSPAQPGPPADPVAASSYFAAGELAEAEAYRGDTRLIGLLALAAELVLLGALALGRPRRVARGLERLGRRRVLGPLAAGAAISVFLAVALLPLGLWAHELAVDVGISVQGLAGWLWDRARSIAIGAVYAALGALILLGLQRRLPRAWWAAAAGVVVAFAAVVSFLAPIVIAPIFNDFDELPEGPLRAEVLSLAERADVEIGEVYRVDASTRSTSLNAYVGGIGSTRRVVLYDNLIAGTERAALRSVVAHELAHVKFDDIPRGILFVAIVAPLGMLFVREAGGALAARAGSGPGEVAALPAYAFVLSVAVLVLGVPGNQLSREVEERADRYALELTGEPEGLIELQTRIGEENLSDPDPPAWSQWLFGTHPTKLERIGLGEAYERSR